MILFIHGQKINPCNSCDRPSQILPHGSHLCRSISYNRHLDLNLCEIAVWICKNEVWSLVKFELLPEAVSLTVPLYPFPFASSKHSLAPGLLVLEAVDELEMEEGVVVMGEHNGTSQSSHEPSDSL